MGRGLIRRLNRDFLTVSWTDDRLATPNGRYERTVIWTDLILARYRTEGYALVEATLQFLGLEHCSETPFQLTGQFSEARFLQVLEQDVAWFSVSASCKEGGKYDLDFKNPDSKPADWKSGSACLKCQTCLTVCPMRDVPTDQQILLRRDGRLLPGERVLPSTFAINFCGNDPILYISICVYIYTYVHIHTYTLNAYVDFLSLL